MANLPVRSFSTIVQNLAAGMQGRATALVDFAVGSVLRSIAEAYAGAALWLQSMILEVLRITRAATSTGADLDSWVADYGLTRIGAQIATGQVTFARFTAGATAPFVANGTLVQTATGFQFVVYGDPTNGAYSATLGGYTMASSVGALIVAVQASIAGSAGNVQAGTITQISSALPGIDTVSNVAAFTNGADQESDPALRSRFQSWILGLARGDLYGLTAAIKAMAVNVQFTVTENFAYDGTYSPGSFYVVCDDGSGAPPGAFVTAVNVAVQSVRPLSVQATTFSPTKTLANVAMTITTATGFDHPTLVAQVAALIALNINQVGLGNSLPYSQLFSWAYSIPGVINVSAVTLNSATADLPASPKVTYKSGVMTIS